MNIKLYIVTYKKSEILNKNLDSLWRSCRNAHLLEVTILSNHPEVIIYPANQRPNLRVVLNTVRSPNAWGYLSRDWNFCLMDGFKHWTNPNSVDWVVLAQNDVEWLDGWIEYLSGVSNLDFISQPRGDQAMAFTIEAVRKVGFFDERFSTLHYQEADYFYRAILNLQAAASINDDHEGSRSEWNPIGNRLIINTHSGYDEADNLHTAKFQLELQGLFLGKWSLRSAEHIFDLNTLHRLTGSRCFAVPREVNWYPFFWDGHENIKGRFLEDYGLSSRSTSRQLVSIWKSAFQKSWLLTRQYFDGRKKKTE